jgi:hypothetical protein
VNLAKLTGSRDCTSSDICPPSYVIRDGEPAPRIHPATGPRLWFLKKNLSNYGLGVAAVKTPEEALALVEKDGVYVLQPHIPSPVLHVLQSICIASVSVCLSVSQCVSVCLCDAYTLAGAGMMGENFTCDST